MVCILASGSFPESPPEGDFFFFIDDAGKLGESYLNLAG